MWIKIFILFFIIQEICSQFDFFPVDLPIPDKLLNVIKTTDKKCDPSKTMYTNGQHPCKGAVIFEDHFNDTFLNKNKWIVESYTPIIIGAPDYEFLVYERNEERLFLNNSKLFIAPLALNTEEDVRGTLDLQDGCTSIIHEQCFVQQVGANILPPVKSAKITTKFSFTYGKIEIKAKLPIGDWLYPQIMLLPRKPSKTGTRMWVAYSRGNSYYIGPNGDIASTVLFGGLVYGATEPARSRLTGKRKSVVPYGEELHTYTLIWEPEKITVMFDNEIYGTYSVDPTDDRFNELTNEFYLSIGVGVGGINDFPDNYTSNNPKPWFNAETKQVKKFFDARNIWQPTWKQQNVKLEVDSVKIFAL